MRDKNHNKINKLIIKKNRILYFFVVIIVFVSCNRSETAIDILNKTINTIDTIESVYYKQDMSRTNPRNTNDTIQRYREMYFKRLVTDSIVGVKGHWYMYVNDKENVIFEDIYDGNKLIRKNNRDSTAIIYDLVNYPEFKRKHFWSHNTLYGMQYEFKNVLANFDTYSLDRLNDTIVNNRHCYQIAIGLTNKISMPGFATEIEDKKGSISVTCYFIDKMTYYPTGMKGESYSIENPGQKMFINQKYYDIKFNLKIDEHEQFNTSIATISGFKIREMKPSPNN